MTEDELAEAHLTNAVFDAHRDDLEFGYRTLAEEVGDADFVGSDCTVWIICARYGWWSVFRKTKADECHYPDPRRLRSQGLLRWGPKWS